MSTTDIIHSLEGDKKALFRFIPHLRGREREARRLSLLQPIDEWLKRARPNPALKAATRAYFGPFVTGERIDDLIYMKRVSRRDDQKHDDFSDNVWSMRPFFLPQHR